MVDIDFSTKVKKDTCVFVNKWQERVDAYLTRMGYDWPETLSVTFGPKYAKIVKEDHGSKSVAGFVDLSNGDVLKPASWAKPAKHARGNVHSEDNGMEAIDQHGFVKYLR